MEGRKIRLVLMCMVVYVCRTAPSVRGNIGEFDEYWKQRSKEAKKAAQKAYKPDPLNVTAHFNRHVHIAVKELNSTRRELGDKRKKYKGPCTAVNPIDKCWRCDPKWEANRKRLADCVIGFAHGTTGGKAGRIYVVTDPSDGDMLNPKPGTLRHAVIQPEPLWIIFARSMNIRLSQELLMASDKTIDGRGAHVHISHGAQISLQFVRNIIIHGLHIHDIKKGSGGMIRDSVNHFGVRTQSDGDGISMFGVSNVWIDHISLANCEDGLIDTIMGSTAITISNCHMTNHNDVMLFGASDWYSKDAVMQVTIAFNHFGQGLVQRMPRCRWGYFHVVNNDYTHWLMYAIGGSTHPTIISQGNRFIAPPNINCKEVTKRDYAPESVWRSWNWRSEGDLFMNGAFFRESGVPVPNKFKDQFAAQPGTMANALTRFSGALGCVPGKPC